jgi:hypothetical protein
MTIQEIFEQYVDLQVDVKSGDITPEEALTEISQLQAHADAINAGFTFTQSLDDLKTLAEEAPSGNSSFENDPEPDSWAEDENSF